ncbi:ankyrin repeat and SOCS box protein 3-like [Asterias rubens]|uniref:ankyrin repeat and SOCS box protein 3-like n=1 Tax=Asterias rubens TaxID=7604 RepID=UPI0014557E22|nr:ankyrin repeat and SOCS box protein 3-like [Asterias rubens]XP_033638210.1 ankyrin repeat and SOCS box protein 3-like [Asterias rubens]
MDFTEAYPDRCSSVGAVARVGDIKSLQQLIANGSCVDIHDNRGWTPLHEAANANHCDCVKILLEHIEDEDDLNVKTWEGETALFFAAHTGNKEMIEQLIHHGAKLDICNQSEIYPLHKAVAGNHKECVELLLQKRADVNCTQWNGWSSLHEAAYQGFADILCILLKSGAKTDVKDDYGIAPVFTAAQYGHLDCLKLLIKHGSNPNSAASDGATPLYITTQENYPECVEYLLEHGASAMIPVCTESAVLAPIHVAADKSHVRCLELLIPKSIEILETVTYGKTEQPHTPMHFAAMKGHTEVVRALLKAGCDPDFGLKITSEDVKSRCWDISHLVCSVAMDRKHFDMAKLLLDSGAVVCSRLGGYCIIRGCEEDVPSLKFLLDYGVDLGCSHMRFVYLPDDLEYANLLLKSGKRWRLDCLDQTGFCSQDWIRYSRRRSTWLKMMKLVYNYVDRLRLCKHNIQYIQDHRELNEVLELAGKPHTLYHLCRVAITEHLGTVCATKIIPKMDFLPKLVRDYLLYDDVTLPSTTEITPPTLGYIIQ